MLDNARVVSKRETKKTRRRHQCAECNKGMTKGSKVLRYSIDYDGFFFNAYICEDCSDKLNKQHEDRGTD